jgi:catechol 1,2-dioxygenase
MADGNTRRAPIAATALALAAFAACSGGGSSDRRAATAPSASVADCRPTQGGPAQGQPSGGELPSEAKLAPGSAIRPEEAAAEAPARRGTPLVLSGTVYANDCRTPLGGAVIEVWQTDAQGVYGPGHGTNNLRCCYLQATVATDADGGYRLETIRPGHYRGEDPPPPAHIHFNVYYRGTPGVFTEVVFAGDPYLENGDAGAEVITLREDGKQLSGRFDIILAGSA